MNTESKFKKIFKGIETRGHYYLLRKIAHRKRKKLVEKKGRCYVNNKIIKEIKEYSREEFGSSSFWPYLALYTEIREEFLPGWIPEDYYRVQLLNKYNPESASLISGYKSIDNIFFEDFSMNILLYTVFGNIYDENRNKITSEDAKKILNDYGREVIVKPELGKGGSGIKFLNSSSINFKELLKESDFIIQPICLQHSELKKLNPKSLNTLRVFTVLDNYGVASVKFAYLKFGTGNNRVDNASHGGGICGINNDGSLHNNFYNESFMDCGQVHPETGITLNQVNIPNYNGVLKACRSAHEKYPYVKFIGWDMAVGVDEEPTLIEWNARYPMLCYGEALFGPLWEEIPN